MNPTSQQAESYGYNPCLFFIIEVTPNWGTGLSTLKLDPFPAFAIRSSHRRIAEIFILSIISLFERGI